MSDFSLPAEFDLSEHFDHGTLMRAITLRPEHALVSKEIDGELLRTRLHGSGAHVYEQTISFYIDPRTGLHLRGLCTCPVGFNCKHVAAALMAYEAQALRASRVPAGAVSGAGAGSGAAGVRPAMTAAAVPQALPRAIETWLDELPQAATASERELRTAAPTKRLMYLVHVDGTRLLLQMHLGVVRRNGEVASHRAHVPGVADMLRTRPSYVTETDEALFAALLPFSLNQVGPGLVLHGRGAAAVLRLLVDSGHAWWVGGGEADSLPSPPGPALRWRDDAPALRLQWRADERGQWRTCWEAEGEPAPAAPAAPPASPASPVKFMLALLPEPHALDPAQYRVGPVQLRDTLGDKVIDWLAKMPPVTTEALPQLVRRLQSAGMVRHVALPLPSEHAQPLQELGALPLQPVLRLLTCPNVPSEVWLEGHQRPPPAGQPVRQAALQLSFRYELASAGRRHQVSFNFPAGASDTAFIERPDAARPGQPALVRFQRDAAAEAAAAETVFKQLQLRPWSRVAAFVLDRLAALKNSRLQAGALPPALEDALLLLVPSARDQWPLLLSQHIPALQQQGWHIERSEDFPYQVYEADDFELSVTDDRPGAKGGDSGEPGEAGNEWFRVGLKVRVGGEPVNLVPLLIGLVQAGWMKLETALREPGGEVLVPWPDDAAPAGALAGSSSQLGRERLLRLPVARVAPLVAWLRGVFGAKGQIGALPRVSRFELGALETLSAGMALRAPPAMTALIEQLRSLRSGEGLPAVAVSPHVNAQLRPYQLDGLAWMDFLRRAQFGGVLADDMGLGKTLQALSLLQNELDAGRLDRPSLVIVPTSLLGNWQAEAARFTPQLRVLVLHGKQRASQFGAITGAHLVVTSYPLAVRDMATLAQVQWHYLVLDEAQRIKNSRSQATLSIKALRARHRLCLSGTPLENHLGELWSLLDFVTPGLLGSEAQFRAHYRNPIEKRQDAAQAEQLARRVRPFVLRRTKLQVASDLPEKTETLLRVELEGSQRDLYETVRATMDSKLRDAIEKQGLARSQIMVLDALLKLRQVCCDPRLMKAPVEHRADAAHSAHPRHHPPSAKLELLLELLPTLVEDGRRILVFSQFTEMLALIEPELQHLHLSYLKLTGDTPDRAALVARFQQGDVPIFLISLKAGGVGLNLTAADTVILYDPWWNPAVEQQAVDRAYRIGQDKPVFVYKLVASGTVEEKMLELQARKAGLADALLSGVAGDVSLTAQDFDELFKPITSAGP